MEYKFKADPQNLTLADITERIGAIIYYYRGKSASTYDRTKEVWEALRTLLNLHEREWDTWIPLLIQKYTPNEFATADKEYFSKLLHALLIKYTQETKGKTPQLQRKLAKIIRDTIDATAEDPYPQVCFFLKEFHEERLTDERFKKCREVINNE